MLAWSRSVVATVAALLPVVFACGGDDPRPNVILIVSDTLRADAIDCRRKADATPALCALADRGVRFEAAYAGAPWTFPSVVTIFTGNHASTYGQPPTRANANGEEPTIRVPDEETLLAEALTARGYDAARFVEAGVGTFNNVFQGLPEPDFDPEQALRTLALHAPPEAKDAALNRYPMFLGALQYLSQIPEDRPFFLVVWIRDPHAPYDPPPKYLKRLLTLKVRFPQKIRYYTGLGHWDRPDLGLRKLREEAPYEPLELALLQRLYRMEVESVDERVGILLELLRFRGFEDDTVIAFTSDHGEEFLEHGRFLHGHTLYEEQLRVPLILAGPGLPRGRVSRERVSLIDLMPTLRNLLHIDSIDDVQGRSLLPLLQNGTAKRDRTIFAGSALNPRAGDALIENRFKLIVATSGDVELYDLGRDPHEQTNIAADRPRIVLRMRPRLEALRKENAERHRVNLARSGEQELRESAERTREQLEELGYLR